MKPRHHSCDPALVRKADAQALKERASRVHCKGLCDANGVSSIRDPCHNCDGYGWIYSVEGAVPKWSVQEMAERYDQRIGWDAAP